LGKEIEYQNSGMARVEATISIPLGKSRVIGVDLFSFKDYLVDDCGARAEGFIKIY
jgi:hypothetical protein